jgi:plasmid stabilization system protein ParE
MKPLVILPTAQDEYVESLSWYRKRSADAMTAFEAAVEQSLDRIGSNPDRWAKCGGPYRSCLVENFPYRLIYREEATRVVVVAVAHSKRRSGYWRYR